MTEIIEYVTQNYIWFLGGMIVILLAIIGSYADKTNFGQKKIKSKKEKDKNLNPETENQELNLDDALFGTFTDENTNNLEQENQNLEQQPEEEVDESLYTPLEDTGKNELEELYGPLETSNGEEDELVEQNGLTETSGLTETEESNINNNPNELEGADLIFDDTIGEQGLEELAEETQNTEQSEPLDTIEADESLADWYDMDNVVSTPNVAQSNAMRVDLNDGMGLNDLAETDIPVQSEEELEEIREEQREQFEEEFNEIVPEREIINEELLDDIENLSVDEDKKFESPEIPDLDDVELPEIKIPKKDIWKF